MAEWLNPKSKTLVVYVKGKGYTAVDVNRLTPQQKVHAVSNGRNKGALAPGWSINQSGQVVKSTPATRAPSVPTAPVQQQPTLKPANLFTGALQQQLGMVRKDAELEVAPINAQIAGLKANNFGQLNAQLGISNRDYTTGLRDYNAQAAAAGMSRSGGIKTNHGIMKSAAEQRNVGIQDQYGQRAVTGLQNQKDKILHSYIQGLMGPLSTAAANLQGGQ